MIDFIESVIPELKIKTITFKDSEQTKERDEDRGAIFDVYVELDNGNFVIVELQKEKQKFYKDRSIYYSSRPIKNQGKKGTWDYKLCPVYVISVLNFRMNKEDKTLIHHVHLISEQTKEIFYDKLQYIYIQLPNLPTQWTDLHNHLEEWLYLIKNLNKKEDIVLEETNEMQKIILEAMTLAEWNDLNWAEKTAYEKAMRHEHDLELCRQYAIEEAREQAIEDERLRSACEFLKLGVPVETIAKATGLSLEAIEALRE